MKTTFKTVLLLCISLIIYSSCSKKDDTEPTTDTNNQTVTADGIITGTISNYSAGAFDAIECIDAGGNVFGNCTPTSDGKFSMKLSTPTNLQEIVAGSDVSVSDRTAKSTMVTMGIYKNNSPVGELFKCNFTSYSSSIMKTANNLMTVFMYFDKNCTIKGTESKTSTTYDLNLKKRWNEVVLKVTGSSTYTLSSTIPTDLKWRYFIEDDYVFF